MKTITLLVPTNALHAYRCWFNSCRNHPKRLPQACAHSIRMLTPTGPDDSRWRRSMNTRFMDNPPEILLVSALSHWSRLFPCINVTFTIDDDVFRRVEAIAAHRGISPEDFCTRCIGYHAMLSGRLKIETAFHRFECALAAEWREMKAKTAERAAAAVETGLDVTDPQLTDDSLIIST